jgi:hypothetical protein
MLGRFRNDLGVAASPEELEAASRASVRNLQTSAAVSIERAQVAQGRVILDVIVQNLIGHKLPTGYPSRRAWLHMAVRDRSGKVVFESGAIAPTGLIHGNDNDTNPGGVEPHYTEIRQADQVQIYESVMSDPSGQPTTGLLTAVRYLKDNRLLPRGFEKTTSEARIAVVGSALEDVDFTGGGDRIRYSVAVRESDGPFRADVALRFQVISFRWAENLRTYQAEETSRFVRYYDAMASSASEVLAMHSASSR